LQDGDAGFADVLNRSTDTIELALPLRCAKHDLVIESGRQVFDHSPVQLMRRETVSSLLYGCDGYDAIHFGGHATDHIMQTE
jgi:hypothetical protein